METKGKVGTAIAALIAAPFTIVALAMDLETAQHVLLLTVLWMASLPFAWGGTAILEGWCDWASLPEKKRASRKLVTPALLGAFPTLLLARHWMTWFPGGIEGVLVAAGTVGAIAPFSWRWVKNHVLARAALEIGGAMKVVRDRATGKTRVIPADEPSGDSEDTELYVGSTTADVIQRTQPKAMDDQPPPPASSGAAPKPPEEA